MRPEWIAEQSKVKSKTDLGMPWLSHFISLSQFSHPQNGHNATYPTEFLNDAEMTYRSIFRWSLAASLQLCAVINVISLLSVLL